MFAPLWKYGRAVVPASGWYEWKKSPDNPRLKQPYFIRGADRQPLFFAALYAAETDGRARLARHPLSPALWSNAG